MSIDSAADQARTAAPPWVLQELRHRERYLVDRQLDPQIFHPFLRPSVNRVLLVADGGLDFSEGDFGLAVFVRTLLDAPGGHVRHDVTLAHLDPVAATQLLPGDDRIARRIPSFTFDDPGHFAPDRYDVVMLFGIATGYGPRGTDTDGNPYPSDRLADPELKALTAHMDSGGGLFATGDHGALGRALSGAVPRARSMRRWSSTAAQEALDQVSMGGPRRNDTNRGTLFDHQSDDVPQTINPTMYTTGAIFRASYPHPLLCGPTGVIRVMPDHPHEGECVAPTDTSQTVPLSGEPEYPPANDLGPRPIPVLVSTNTVPAGNTAATGGGDKDSTYAQEFGGICAYDGHRAGVGRVVTDATWHHFVNVNLVGMAQAGAPAAFDRGFLGSAAGIEHLKAIRAYYRNLVVWGSRPERIREMNTRLAFGVLYDGRVLEAVLTSTSVRLADLSPIALRLVGSHARDVLGRTASQCQSLRLILDLVVQRALPDLIPEVDPWWPKPERTDPPARSDWVDGTALLDFALGGALVGLREALGEPNERNGDVDSDRIAEVMAESGARGIELGLRSLAAELDQVRGLLGV